jgi:hypothetical protein
MYTSRSFDQVCSKEEDQKLQILRDAEESSSRGAKYEAQSSSSYASNQRGPGCGTEPNGQWLKDKPSNGIEMRVRSLEARLKDSEAILNEYFLRMDMFEEQDKPIHRPVPWYKRLFQRQIKHGRDKHSIPLPDRYPEHPSDSYGARDI